jgi:hypothetical protein
MSKNLVTGFKYISKKPCHSGWDKATAPSIPPEETKQKISIV